MIHVVQPGESLYQIGKRYNISTTRLMELNNMKPWDANNLQLGQKLVVSEGQQQPLSNNASAQYYTVRPGDSLFSISRSFGVSTNDLMRMNQLPNANLSPGQRLLVSGQAPPPTFKLPTFQGGDGGSGQYYAVQPGDTLYGIAQQFGTTPALLLRLNNLPSNARLYPGQKLMVKEPNPSPQQIPPSPHTHSTPISDVAVYTVQRGDSLFAIAQRFNTTPQQIKQVNGLSDDATIYIGQLLKVGQPRQEPPKVNQELRSYMVQRGDNLAKIANQFGTTPQEIIRINNLNGTGIYIGQRLILPTEKEVPQPPAPSPSVGSRGSQVSAPQNVIPSHLKGKADAIRQARSIFQLQAINGIGIFGNGLAGPVGRVTYNNPADLDKVQQRLIQLGLLEQNHGESSSELLRKLGRSPIWHGSIPKTVRGIERFQQQRRVDYWLKRQEHVQMMGTNKFTKGVVAPDDLTYKIMREYTEYTLNIPHPTNRGQYIVAEFDNFVRSSFNQYYNGVGFKGNVVPNLPLEAYTSLGIDQSMAQGLMYVSKHEGNFDAINTYDKANFSWGFIQFAGKGGGANGSLNAVIATMKHRQPQLFAEYFQKIGIDVDIKMKNGEVDDGELYVFDLYGITGKFEATGLDAEVALKHDKQLYGAFIRAAYHPSFQVAQLERAVVGYVRPALGIKTDINTGRMQLRNVPLAGIIRSPMGRALMLDLTVNQWINKTGSIFRAAIETVAAQYGLHSPQLLQQIDERAVIQSIIANAGSDGRIRARGSSILNGSLSPAKIAPPVPLA